MTESLRLEPTDTDFRLWQRALVVAVASSRGGSQALSDTTQTRARPNPDTNQPSR
jgi:hypothetical protein